MKLREIDYSSIGKQLNAMRLGLAALLILPLTLLAELHAPILATFSSGAPIEGLVLETTPSMFTESVNGTTKNYVKVSGNYSNPGWTLFLEGQTVRLTPQGNFSVRFLAPERAVRLEFMAKGPQGEIQQQTLRAIYEEGKVSKLKATPPEEKVKELNVTTMAPATVEADSLRFSLDWGMDAIQYDQNLLPRVSQTALTAGLGAQYLRKNSHWGAGVELHSTVLSLSTSPSNLGMRFLKFEVSGLGSFEFSELWRLIAALNANYSSVLAIEDPIGIQNVLGLGVSTKLERQLGSHMLWAALARDLLLDETRIALGNHRTHITLGYDYQMNSIFSIGLYGQVEFFHLNAVHQNRLAESNRYAILGKITYRQTNPETDSASPP